MEEYKPKWKEMKLKIKFPDFEEDIIADVSNEDISRINEAIWILLHTLKAESITLLKTEEDIKEDKNGNRK